MRVWGQNAPVKVELIAAIVLASLAITATAGAQEPAWVRINLKVTDAGGAVVPGASVKTEIPPPPASLDQSWIPITTLTGVDGIASIDLPPGHFGIAVRAPGYRLLYRDVELFSGPPTRPYPTHAPNCRNGLRRLRQHRDTREPNAHTYRSLGYNSPPDASAASFSPHSALTVASSDPAATFPANLRLVL